MADQISRDGRTWMEHFPEGDLWVFGYGYIINGIKHTLHALALTPR